MKTNSIKITESQLKQMVSEAIYSVLNETNEGVVGGAMRRAYNSGRYDGEGFNLNGSGEYIRNGNGNTDAESYQMWKNNYKQDKANLAQGKGINPNSKRGGYTNWSNTAYQQDYVDNSATNALASKPGFGGKVARAASVPLMGAANLAGRIAKRFGGKQVSESQMYNEIMEMINEAVN